jgi:cytochrome c553
MIKALTLSLATLAMAGLCTPALAQDAKAGEKKAAMCIGCHGIAGYQASFPEVYRVPMISGQNAAYIVASLQAYQKGERRHPTMRGIAASLTDQDMADLGAFYEQHGRSSVVPASQAVRQPSAPVKALLDKGACASCHGTDYNKTNNPAFPKLAGQHADYLYVALRSYKVQGNPNVGRSNAIMGAQVQQFKPAELRAMAEYLGSLHGDLRTVPQSRFR